MVAVNLVAVGMQGPQGPPGPAGSGSAGLPAWFLASSTTGSNGAPLNTVTPPTSDVPYLYWDDTAGTGLWITRPSDDADEWVGLGRIVNGVGPGLSLGGPFLSGPMPVLQAIEGDGFWEVGIQPGGSGPGWTAFVNYTDLSYGTLYLSTGNPNDLGIPAGDGMLCLDTSYGSGTGIWQYNAEQATPGWVPYGGFQGTYSGTSGITLADTSSEGITFIENGSYGIAIVDGVIGLYNSVGALVFNEDGSLQLSGSGVASLFTCGGNPNGTVTGTAVGDLCLSSEPALYQWDGLAWVALQKADVVCHFDFTTVSFYGLVSTTVIGQLVGGDTPSGTIHATATVPATTYAPGDIITGSNLDISGIPLSNHGLVANVRTVLMSMDGTTGLISDSSAVAAPNAGVLSFPAPQNADVSAEEEFDLEVFNTGVFSTLAGGVYGIMVSLTVTWEGPVTIVGVSPSFGSTNGGATVVITGTNMSNVTAVNFGPTPAASFVVDSATQITAVTPPNFGESVDITVTNLAGTSAVVYPDSYIYDDVPTIVALSPASGGTAGGDTVSIQGSGFLSVTGVSFGGTPATGFTISNDALIVATTPAGTGQVDVIITNPTGTSSIVVADEYTYS